MFEVGIDVGGTFTDVVVLETESGATTWLKVSTQADHPNAGVLAAIEATRVPFREIAGVRLGMTLGVNAILTRSGAVTGLITTAGFRDVLEIRRTHRQSLFNLNEQFPRPLVPRNLRLEVRERIDADGTVVLPLDEDGIRRAWNELRDSGVEAVAIAFLFSFENPAHERRARELLEDEGVSVPISLSSDVLPAYREYERTSTTVVAAYIARTVERHLGELDDELARRGLERGRLAVLTNSGGALSPRAATRLPVSTLLSGPVGGVQAARWIAVRAGWSNVLTMDMGGTSCDVSGVVDGIPDERLDMVIDGHTISYPTFDIESIGAGGGSIAWIDSGGMLRVGPQSAGSVPGPACYGRGGVLPTVTDANVVLGRYETRAPLGGSITLDLDAARRAIETHVADPLGFSVDAAAAGIVRIVNALMMSALRVISVERGRDVRDYTLVAFGGAGPTHAAEIARELAIPRVLVPPFPGCASAFGAVISGSRRDFLRTIGRPTNDLDLEALNAVLGQFTKEARSSLRQEGFAQDSTRLETWFDLRYTGQAHELSVPAAPGTATADTVAATVHSFHESHAQLYGHSFDDVPVELVHVRMKAFGKRPEPPMWWDWGHLGAAAELDARRLVYFQERDEMIEARILLRRDLRPGESIPGPAVIHQMDSTVLVPPSFVVEALDSGSLILHATEAIHQVPQAAAELEHLSA